ncbi:MAG: 50S ribosomal protein L25 [Candidatus Poribacteria bacterium]|nr:50S ribosomal protein L25 [Candidatus Poribacteria bacterium]
MRLAKLEAQKRRDFGKSAGKALRRNGAMPAILYGRHEDVIPLQLDARSFQRFLQSNGENVLIELEIADHGNETIMIREIQRDPVKQNLLHTDFIRISLDEPVTSAVPIVLGGSAIGIQAGGIVEFARRQLHVRCLPTILPDTIDVDVSGLDIDDFIRIEDLTLDETVEVLDDPQTIVVLVNRPRVEAEAEPEEEIEGDVEETAIEEPELITRKRGEDTEE